jgi:hypothetical protein
MLYSVSHKILLYPPPPKILTNICYCPYWILRSLILNLMLILTILTFKRAQVETISTISTISDSKNDLISVSYINSYNPDEFKYLQLVKTLLKN